MRVLLASSSPRRKELLKKIFTNFDTVDPDVVETIESNNPCEEAIRLALLKAKAVTRGDYDVIIASDTIVFCNGIFYGKPHNAEVATQYIKELSGMSHRVITGVAILTADGVCTFYDESEVHFFDLSAGEIKTYVEEYKPFDKAGAYGIQDEMIVESFKGSYDNIVGLPTEKLRDMLRLIRVIK